MCLAINLSYRMLQNAFFSPTKSSGQPKNDAKTLPLPPPPPSPFHGNFCNCNSISFAILGSTSTVIHSVKQRLLRNRQPLATSCAKDYKSHSFQETSFAESPNKNVCPHVRPPPPAPLLHSRAPSSLSASLFVFVCGCGLIFLSLRVAQCVALVLHPYLLYTVLHALRDICIVMYYVALKQIGQEQCRPAEPTSARCLFFSFFLSPLCWEIIRIFLAVLVVQVCI